MAEPKIKAYKYTFEEEQKIRQDYLNKIQVYLNFLVTVGDVYKDESEVIYKDYLDKIWAFKPGVKQFKYPLTELQNFGGTDTEPGKNYLELFDKFTNPYDWRREQESETQTLQERYTKQQESVSEAKQAMARQTMQGAGKGSLQDLAIQNAIGQADWQNAVNQEDLRGQQLQSMTNRPEQPALNPQVYEDWRSSQLQGMQSPRDWINKWMLEHTPNPISNFYRQQADPSIQIPQLQDEVLRLMETQAWIDSHPPAIPGSDYAQLAQSIPVKLQAAQEQLDSVRNTRANATEEELATAGRRTSLLPAATLPATPDWLTTLTRGLQPGQTLEKNRLVTPSLQQWQGLAPSQQEMVTGYSDWSGGNWADIIAQMNRSRTNTPYGAGFNRFTPVSQRTG